MLELSLNQNYWHSQFVLKSKAHFNSKALENRNSFIFNSRHPQLHKMQANQFFYPWIFTHGKSCWRILKFPWKLLKLFSVSPFYPATSCPTFHFNMYTLRCHFIIFLKLVLLFRVTSLSLVLSSHCDVQNEKLWKWKKFIFASVENLISSSGFKLAITQATPF